MIRKLYKYKKLVICVMFILGVAFYFTIKHFTGNHDVAEVQHTYTGLSYIQSSQVIDKEILIRALKSKAELVSNEGVVDKVYKYSDSIFKEHGLLKDFLGERKLEVVSRGYFKTGIDLSTIGTHNITVYGQTVFIKIPADKIKLISLDVPFDQLQFHSHTGLFRSQLNLEEKQVLYGEIRSVMEREILNNQEIKKKTLQSTIDALNKLLVQIPNCKKVIIQPELK